MGIAMCHFAKAWRKKIAGMSSSFRIRELRCRRIRSILRVITWANKVINNEGLPGSPSIFIQILLAIKPCRIHKRDLRSALENHFTL